MITEYLEWFGYFCKNYDKLSFDISGEIKNAKEIPYGNDDDELFWFVAETLYLTEDLFEQVQINKNHISSNIYYRLDNENELSAFYNYTGAVSYTHLTLPTILRV